MRIRKKLTKMEKIIFPLVLSVNDTNKVFVLNEWQREELIKFCKEKGMENVEDRIFVQGEKNDEICN